MISPKLIKYILAGLSTVLLDFLSLILIKEFFGTSATLAVIVNQLFIWLYNFYLNKYWTFANRQLPHQQLIKYFSLAGTNYLLAIGIMHLFSDQLGIYYLWVRLATIACMTIWNYLLYKHWVYAD